MNPLSSYLLLSAFLFAVGLAGVLTRRNTILILIGVELMLNAANLNFVAFWRHSPNPAALSGVLFATFSIAIAAAEAAVGLALVIAVYRHHRTAKLDEIEAQASLARVTEEPLDPQFKALDPEAAPGRGQGSEGAP